MFHFEEKNILIRQKYMQPGVFAWMLILITTLLWMSFDFYLPALPEMRDSFGVSESALNLTIVSYQIFTAAGTLIGGPLSDKYGRLRLLRIGYLLFLSATLLCGFAESLSLLIFERSIAALGCGFVLTVLNAMIKDSFHDDAFQKVMTLLQSMACVGPVFSPILGAAILTVLPWHFVFIFIALLGMISAIPAFLMSETLPEDHRLHGSTLQAIGGLFTITRNLKFTTFLLIVAMIAASYYAFMSVCSYIYIEIFHTSYIVYGIFYGASCMVSIIAPFIYLHLTKKLQIRKIVHLCIFLNFTCGTLLLLQGDRSALGFYLILCLFLLAEGMIRPLGIVILMNQYEHNVGAVSAIFNFVTSIFGVLGSITATLSWNNYIDGLGVVFILCAVLPLLLWVPLLRIKPVLKGL